MGLSELNGAAAGYMHAVGALLLVSRIVHYVTINIQPVAPTRVISMLGTTTVFLMTSGFLIYVSF